MTDSAQIDSPGSRRQFSLWQLMLCVVIIGLFLGIVRLMFPQDFVAAYALILAGMAGAIGILALIPVHDARHE